MMWEDKIVYVFCCMWILDLKLICMYINVMRVVVGREELGRWGEVVWKRWRRIIGKGECYVCIKMS